MGLIANRHPSIVNPAITLSLLLETLYLYVGEMRLYGSYYNHLEEMNGPLYEH